MDGILNVNKPQGKTSFGIVAIIKKLGHEKHVGHAGTLDPLATGVLPVCLGKATRIIEYLSESPKTYVAEFELGLVSDTYDSEGSVTRQADANRITLAEIESALSSFRGLISQVPPMHSALKLHGQPLYELARAGITVDRKAREVRIFRLEIIDWQPPVLKLEIECSKGTYIRSLAHDLGQKLECGAIMTSLARTGYGSFSIENAISLPELESASQEGTLKELLLPMDYALSAFPATTVNPEIAQDIRHGKSVVLDISPSPLETSHTEPASRPEIKLSYMRACSEDGLFLAMLEYVPDNGTWHPEKVFI